MRIDQIALRIGDSLLATIANEITDGDFLVAVVSPDSLESEWCRKEVAIALTQGINQKKPKVLPIKFRGAAMPPPLTDVLYGDADQDDVETLAAKLSDAMAKHLAGEGESVLEQALAPSNGAPVSRDRDVAARIAEVEDIAEGLFDLLAEVDECQAGGRFQGFREVQRRFRFRLRTLPEWLILGLPVIEMLSSVDEDFALNASTEQLEADATAELLSARAHLLDGRPVPHRWRIVQPLGKNEDFNRDAIVFDWQIQRDGHTSEVHVYVSESTMGSSSGLPTEVEEAKRTEGRSVVTTLLDLEDPPRQISVTTAGISWNLPA